MLIRSIPDGKEYPLPGNKEIVLGRNQDGKYGISAKDTLVSRRQIKMLVNNDKNTLNVTCGGAHPSHICYASGSDSKTLELRRSLLKGDSSQLELGNYILIRSDLGGSGSIPFKFGSSLHRLKSRKHYLFQLCRMKSDKEDNYSFEDNFKYQKRKTPASRALSDESANPPGPKRQCVQSLRGIDQDEWEAEDAMEEDRPEVENQIQDDQDGEGIYDEKVYEDESDPKPSCSKDDIPKEFSTWLGGHKHGWGKAGIREAITQSWAYMPVISTAIRKYQMSGRSPRLRVPMGCSRDISSTESKFWDRIPEFSECVKLLEVAFATFIEARMAVNERNNWDRSDHLKASVQNDLGGLEVPLQIDKKRGTEVISQKIQMMAAKILLWERSLLRAQRAKAGIIEEKEKSTPTSPNLLPTDPLSLSSPSPSYHDVKVGVMTAVNQLGGNARARREEGDESGWRIAIAPISIREMQFPPRDGACIALAAIRTFLKRYINEHRLRIVVVCDPIISSKKDEDESKQWSQSQEATLFEKCFRESLTDGEKKDKRICILSRGRIWKMRTDHQMPCSFIVNLPNTWRFTGGALSTALEDVSKLDENSKSLSMLTRSIHKKGAKVGNAYSIEIEKYCSLNMEGVDTVINALGPNLNPRLPDPLTIPPSKGQDSPHKQLLDTYASVLEEFAKLLELRFVNNSSKEYIKQPKEEYLLPSEDKKSKISMTESISFKYEHPPRHKRKPVQSHWKMALVSYAKDPVKYKDSIYWKDEKFLAVYDAYPKAKVHLLMIPRDCIIDLSDLRSKDIPLIEEMYSRSLWLIERLKASTPNISFGKIRFGFHAIPSLSQIHLHIISDDFESESLKNKKHWNSFTTEFFIKPIKLIASLKEEGKFEPDRAKFMKLLKKPLECHRCGEVIKFLPRLKSHIAKCRGQSSKPVNRRESSI